jgi:1-deoxy-D-xylulose-5-phosphate synthase
MATVAVDAATRLAGMGVSVTVADPRWIHPIAPELMTLVADHQVVITLEDNTIGGGLGAALSVAAHTAGLVTRVIPMGLPVGFVPVGDRSTLLAQHGLDAEHLVDQVLGTRWRRSKKPAAVTLVST